MIRLSAGSGGQSREQAVHWVKGEVEANTYGKLPLGVSDRTKMSETASTLTSMREFPGFSSHGYQVIREL